MSGRRPTEPATTADVSAVFAMLDLRRKDHLRVAAVLRVLEHGPRRSEVCALNVSDFTTLEGAPVLRVRTLKRRDCESWRNVPLSQPVAALLTRYVRLEHGPSPEPSAPLFLTPGVRYPCRVARITPKFIAYHLRRLRVEAGIAKRLTAHSFRHGFATRLLQSGSYFRTVQELLGHASVSSTQVYLHTSFGRMVEAVRRMSDGE